MKFSSLLLAGSLATNLVVAAIFVAGLLSKPAPEAAVRPPSAPAIVPADAPAIAAGLWSEIRSDDLHKQRENLEADGFPPAMIRAIIIAQVRARFAAQRKALEAAQPNPPFWQSPAPDSNTQAALRAAYQAEAKAIREVMGPDPDTGPAAALRRQFPGFSADKIDQLAAIQERYGEQRSEIYRNLRGAGAMLPDEQARFEALEKAMHGEIAAILTPPELEDYDLRTSNIANQLRYNLVAFDASEQEFRTLFRLQREFDEQFPMLRSAPDAAQMRARNEAQGRLNEAIKSALGPERFLEYQRATDYNYRQTAQLVDRLNLPVETAHRLYAIQKEFEQRRSAIYRTGSGSTLAVAQITQQNAALQREAIERVTSILGGATQVEAYKQYGGSWLASMVPRPRITPPAPPKP